MLSSWVMQVEFPTSTLVQRSFCLPSSVLVAVDVYQRNNNPRVHVGSANFVGLRLVLLQLRVQVQECLHSTNERLSQFSTCGVGTK